MKFGNKSLVNKSSSSKGKFLLNFPGAIAEFENAMKKFPVKKILYRSIFRGKGLEFDSYREFAPSDDASMIDWKASLRADQLLSKKYIEEQDLNIYFLVDVSNSMLFGSGEKLKAEYAAEVIVALSHLIMGSGDRVGLVMFNKEMVKIVRPATSKIQFSIIASNLADESLYGGGFDFNKAIEFVLKSITTPYTVFILVSDFISVPKKSLRNLKLMGNQFETIALMVRDPLDEKLPKVKFQFAIQDPYSNRQMIIDPDFAGEKFEEGVRRQKEKLKEMFRDSRINFLELDTSKPFAIPVSMFLRGRAKGGRI